MRPETPYFQVSSFFFRQGPGSNPRPNPAAVQTPRQLHPISGRTLCRRAPNAHGVLQPASRCPHVPPRGAHCGPGRRGSAPAPRPLLPAHSPPLGRSTAGGRGRGYSSTHMSRSRAAARSLSLPRAGSRRPRRTPGPGHEGRVREKPGRGGGGGRGGRASPLPWTEGGGIRGAGGGGGVAGATRPPGAGPARGKLRGRRRGLGKDTCCTVLWMVVSGDWDSFIQRTVQQKLDID